MGRSRRRWLLGALSPAHNGSRVPLGAGPGPIRRPVLGTFSGTRYSPRGSIRTVPLRRGAILVVVALLLAACTSVPSTGTLRGVLMQEIGGAIGHPPVPLGDTTVVVKAKTGKSWRVTTGANGRFSRALPPGSYVITPVCQFPQSVTVRLSAGSTASTTMLCGSAIG